MALFRDGLGLIAARTGLRSLGLVPWFAEAWWLPAEDAVALDGEVPRGPETGTIRIVVPQLSRIANFDDLDPLRAEPDVAIEIMRPGRALPGDADLVLLAGSKSTIAELDFLRPPRLGHRPPGARAARRRRARASARASRCWAGASRIRTASRVAPTAGTAYTNGENF